MILMGFILGFPANEIVIPVILMAYLAQGSLLELESLSEMKTLLVANGWTWTTAVCVVLFSPDALAVFHNAADHPQGNRQLEMDCAGCGPAYGHGSRAVRADCRRIQAGRLTGQPRAAISASAQRMPSTAADVMPPAYPAPSPQG